MATTTRIKAVGFADHIDMAIKDYGLFTVKKNRMVDIKGVWKATEAYQLNLDAKDMFTLLKQHKYNQPSISTQELINHFIKEGLLPDNKRLFIYNSDWHYDFLNVRGFFCKDEDGNAYRHDETTLTVFCADDFVQLPKTKKELEIEKAIENRKAMQKLNNLVIKDNLLKALNDKGYECTCYEGNGMNTVRYDSKKAFNALVKDAIEYYLNDIVLKELGCKITVPKQKSNHCYGYGDILCFLGDIQITEGE